MLVPPTFRDPVSAPSPHFRVHLSVWHSIIAEETRDYIANLGAADHMHSLGWCVVCCAWRFSWFAATPKHNSWSHHSRHQGCPTEMQSPLGTVPWPSLWWGIQHVRSQEWCGHAPGCCKKNQLLFMSTVWPTASTFASKVQHLCFS